MGTCQNCLGEGVLTCTHNLCFGAKIRKISIPQHTPVLLWGIRGYRFHGHVFLMIFSEILKDLDVFEEQKKKALTDSSGAILILMNYLMSVVGDIENGHADIDREKLFKQFMQVNQGYLLVVSQINRTFHSDI